MPEVSFILPAYKLRFLHEAIASILAQTYRDFELVVVDDCSPENLKGVVDEFHDERLTYHRNEMNLGGKDLVAAWNHAMEYARGEWCVLASDDDVYLSGFLEEMMRLHEKYPHSDLIHARSAVIDENGKMTAIAEERIEYESQIQMVYQCAANRCRQQAPDFMFRHSALKEIGGFVNFPLAWFSDDATWMTLSRNGCAHSASVLFLFRLSGANISSTYGETVCQKIAASNAFFAWLVKLKGNLKAATKEEEFFMDHLLSKTQSNVFAYNSFMLGKIKSLRCWWRAVRHSGFSTAAQHNLIYNRFPRAKALRILIRMSI